MIKQYILNYLISAELKTDVKEITLTTYAETARGAVDQANRFLTEYDPGAWPGKDRDEIFQLVTISEVRDPYSEDFFR